jgi:hypothetical protein
MIVPPFHGWMTGPPPPNRKKKKILPFPLSPKPKKGKNWLHWLHTEPSSVPTWYFYYGPIPLHNRMDIYCAINRAEWAIPWNSGVLQFKKGPRPPPPSLPCMCIQRAKRGCTGHDGRVKPAVAPRPAPRHRQTDPHLTLEHFRPGAAHFETSFLSTTGWNPKPSKTPVTDIQVN